MNENGYAQAAPQPEKKHSGVSSAAIICLILGAIIFFTGLILYYNTIHETHSASNSFMPASVMCFLSGHARLSTVPRCPQ